MTKIYDNITELIGDTPMLKLQRSLPQDAADVYVKLESFNAGGSVKDRIALNMIEVAEQEGKIKPGDTLVEATSGNTGVGIALVGAAKGYNVEIFMPETMTKERQDLMRAYGAKINLTPGDGGMKEAIAQAEALAKEDGYVMLFQFDNLANPAVHEATTGPEIIQALDGAPDAFVAGVGTGGTLTGAGRALRQVNKDVQLYAVEPQESAVLSGNEPGKHGIQGLGAGFVPSVLDTEMYNEIIQVSTDKAREAAREIGINEGLLVGVSSGAAIAGAIEVAKRLGKGKKVVVVAPDTGERYLSTGLFSEQ
ncbi:cysteine synthase A [Aerococcus suis]|uniref:Cysteine synthase n=1 Tax=Aerococcus suis TaxID=371602 RepID=A0A1W1Z4H5_9LACT|nr:cysteine synthase A [Aerococcus suis]MCI7240261.1 cysteine synthase A [Aerococcus suis]MDD7758862.1 cysteine synthase A [Aerococcus suis]MDY4646423.1 cysteine synthase A [Aerococcus suis]SMC43001.1 cysteine synthase [Aerococcus suis]